MVTTALQQINKATAESAEELRRLELERLDEWLLRPDPYRSLRSCRA